VLARAATGLYTEWSFRDTPGWVKLHYFIPRPGGRYEIHPWLKLMVSFSSLNLATDTYPSLLNHTNAMDLVVCRNVLLYFAPARIPQVVQRFQRALVDGGQLVLGAVEASQMVFPQLTPVPSPGVALYLKTGADHGGVNRDHHPVVGDHIEVGGAPASAQPQRGKTYPAQPKPSPSHRPCPPRPRRRSLSTDPPSPVRPPSSAMRKPSTAPVAIRKRARCCRPRPPAMPKRPAAMRNVRGCWLNATPIWGN
jgi:hypothetical protein